MMDKFRIEDKNKIMIILIKFKPHLLQFKIQNIGILKISIN
jgi:hypothetical protein